MEEAARTDTGLGEEPEGTVVEVVEVWGVPVRAVHCAHCGEDHLVPADDVPARCPFCLQGPVTPEPASLPEESPEQILPYEVSESRLVGILSQWTQGGLFSPAELEAGVLMRRVRRYLVPQWLVDGQVEGAWRADVGFDYQAVSYQDRYRDGRGWSSEEVTEGRVRWEPRVGRIDRGYENLDTPALDDHRALMARLGRFDLRERTEYTSGALAGAAVRVPSLEPEAAWPGAQSAFVRAAQEECRQAAGADHIRDFVLEARYSGLNWTLLLLPAYVTWYREGERIWPVLVNGQSGHVSGVRRASSRKANTTSLILGAVALLVVLVGILLALGGALLPPVAVVGAVVLIIGLLMVVVAPIPAIAVWVHNRRSESEEWAR